jgi:hypothetical protein
MPADYTRFTIADIENEFAAIAREAAERFGRLTEHELNWKADAARWSVAQCLDHLLTIDRQMFQAMDEAMDPSRPKSLVQRIPVLPGVVGRLMIRSLGPVVTRKMPAPKKTEPSASTLGVAIVGAFIYHQGENARHVRELGARSPERVVMRSPFAPVGYSVLDACRIVCAHERRHFEQAKRVTEDRDFPGKS